MSKLRLLDLFSGIGGFSLGLERTGGFETVAFCEINKHCQQVLGARWKGIPIYGDVQELGSERLASDGIAVDAICGGFPCQDASIANTSGAGAVGQRTGLFREIVRLARGLGPELIILENVPELLNRGFGDVLGALAGIGYDAEWDCISASSLGLPHKRERLFIIAYPSGSRRQGSKPDDSLFVSAFTSQPEPLHQAAALWRELVDDQHLLRSGDGLSVAMERRRLSQCGNAVVPQIPELLGRAWMDAREAA